MRVESSIIWAALVFGAVALASADEHRRLSLLRPDSLLGWDQGAQDRKGWAIADGRLTAGRDSTPLLAGWTFGEFELSFGWSTSENARLEFKFIGMDARPLVRVVLSENDKCGIVREAEPDGFQGNQITAAKNGQHRAVIRRQRERLLLLVDGKETGQTSILGSDRWGLSLVASGAATLEDLRLKEPAGEGIVEDSELSAWWTPGNKTAWRVENGELVKQGGGGNYLRSEKEYGNFTLALQYQMNRGGNSGVGIRTPRPGWPSSDGMEMQLYDQPGLDGGSNMSIYRNVPPVARADKSGEWNDAVIKAEGYIISAWVNGELVQHANTRYHPELKFRHLKGWIGFQDHGGTVRFRNVHLAEIPDGIGLEDWYHHDAPRGAELVLDRLLNSERLSVDDGIRSGVIQAAAGGKEQVIADLAGPGAVVGLMNTVDEGRLAFYFDGEKRPSIDCAAKDLHKHVPALAPDANPILTYLAYRKHLKIVLRDAQRGDWQLDYVTFPEGVEVETFADRQTSLPRGWLEPIDYRVDHHRYGVQRQFDPLALANSGKKTIEPGSSLPLVSLDGAGIIHWLKLQAPKESLGREDLWLEVTVDGESEPAISAPARYLFAAIHEGKNYHNFLMLDRDGLTSLLAMPFGRGISIAAKNRGSQPITGVALTASYEEAEVAKSRMRLRGAWQPRSPANDAIKLTGPGRMVAYVGEDSPAEQYLSLVVDGKPRAGQEKIALQDFLGGTPGETSFHRCLSGRSGGLAWRYLLLAPVDFRESLALEAAAPAERLVLYYQAGKNP